MRDAIKQLEARLVGALQANADAVLAQSGGRASEQLGAAELRGRLRELGERMERMQEEVLRCRAVEQERTAEVSADVSVCTFVTLKMRRKGASVKPRGRNNRLAWEELEIGHVEWHWKIVKSPACDGYDYSG